MVPVINVILTYRMTYFLYHVVTHQDTQYFPIAYALIALCIFSQ